MERGIFGPFEGVVPGAIAEAGVRGHPRAAGGSRAARPLGKRHADVLAGVPLFSGLSKRHLRKLAERADEVVFRAGETIVGSRPRCSRCSRRASARSSGR